MRFLLKTFAFLPFSDPADNKKRCKELVCFVVVGGAKIAKVFPFGQIYLLLFSAFILKNIFPHPVSHIHIEFQQNAFVKMPRKELLVFRVNGTQR